MRENAVEGARPAGSGVGRGAVALAGDAAFEVVGVGAVQADAARTGVVQSGLGELLRAQTGQAEGVGVVGVARHQPAGHHEDALAFGVVSDAPHHPGAGEVHAFQRAGPVVGQPHLFAPTAQILGVGNLNGAIERIVFLSNCIFGIAQVGRVKGAPIYNIFLICVEGVIVYDSPVILSCCL